MLEVLKLTHAHADHIALEEVSFEVGERELPSIVGTSGHGNTTVFRLFARLHAEVGRLVRADATHGALAA